MDTNNQKLNATLKSLGLYAADTVGDGNCLFRALSDQYYGSPSKHLELRAEICDFIAENKDEYAPFIENEKGIDHHLANMRQTGGSH
jgi:OTU domain-containing protein 3